MVACTSAPSDRGSDDPPAEAPAAARGPIACEGDALLLGSRIGTQRFRGSSVDALQISADGSVLMTAGGSHAVLWDPKSGERRKTFDAWSAKASLSADGKSLALFDFGLMESGVRVIDVDSGDVKFQWETELGDVGDLALSPDGNLLAVDTGKNGIELRPVSGNGSPHRLTDIDGELYALAFAPRGDRLAASGKDAQLIVWKTRTGDPTHLEAGETTSITGVRFSADGNTLAAVDSRGFVRLYDADDPAPRTSFRAVVPGEPDELRGVAVSSGGSHVLVRSWSGVVSLWKTDGAELVAVLAEGLLASGSVAFTPDGATAVAAVHNGAIRFWDATTGAERDAVEPGNAAEVDAAVWLGNTHAVVAAGGHTANVWDLRCGKLESTLGGHARRVQHVVASADGSKIATADQDGRVRLWDGASKALLHEEAVTSNQVGALALSADGSRIATRRRSGIVVQDTETFDAVFEEPTTLDSDTVTAMALSHDGSMLLAGDTMGQVRWLDVASGASLAVREDDYASNIRSIRFSPDGRRIVTTASDKVRVFDAATGTLELTFGVPGWSVSNAAWFSDNQQLVFGDSDGHLWVVDAGSGKVKRAASMEDVDITAIALRPDDGALLTGHEDTTMLVWDPAKLPLPNEDVLEVERTPADELRKAPPLPRAAAEKCPKPAGTTEKLPPCATARVRASAFLLDDSAGSDGALALSDDGTRLAMPGDEHLAILEVPSGRLLGRLSCCQYGAPESVVFSPDAKTVAVTADFGNTALWGVEGGRKNAEWSFRALGLAVSEDGKRWAGTTQDGALHLVDRSGKIAKTLTEEGYSARPTLAFDPDGDHLLVTSEWSIDIWDTASGERVYSLEEDPGLPEELEDGLYWSGFDREGRLAIRSAAKLHTRDSKGSWTTKAARVRAVVEDWDPPMFACSQGARVCAMATESALQVDGKTLLKGEVERVSVTPSGKWAAVDDGASVSVWDLETKTRVTPEAASRARRLSMADNGSFVTAHDRGMQLWTAGAAESLQRLDHDVSDVALTPDSSTALVLAESGLLRIALDSGTSSTLATGYLGGLTVSGDGSRVAITQEDDDERTKLKVFDVGTGATAWTTVADVDELALSHNGRTIAMAIGEELELWEVGGERITTIAVEHSASNVGFSPDGRLVVVTGHEHIDVYAAEDGHEIAMLGEELDAWAFDFAPGGRYLVTGGLDHAVRVFDVVEKRLLVTLAGHDASVEQVAVGGDPLRVVSLDTGGTMLTWDLAPWLQG